LLTIQAYIDESGIKGTDAVFVLAGFIARAERWAAFSDAWKEHLSDPPSIEYLKMNEAVKLDGQFRFWDAEARDRKLAGCVAIIQEYAPDCGIYFINDLVAWEKIVPQNFVKSLSDPQFMGFHAIILAVCNEVMDSGTKEELEIIFDEHLIFGPRVSLWYPVIKEMIQTTKDPRVHDVSSIMPTMPMFKDDRKFIPLQAADMLAWFLRTTFRDRVPGLETVWRKPAPMGFGWLASELLRDLPHSKYSTIWGHERIARIQELSREMEPAPELLAKWRERLGIRPPKPAKRRK